MLEATKRQQNESFPTIQFYKTDSFHTQAHLADEIYEWWFDGDLEKLQKSMTKHCIDAKNDFLKNERNSHFFLVFGKQSFVCAKRRTTKQKHPETFPQYLRRKIVNQKTPKSGKRQRRDD